MKLISRITALLMAGAVDMFHPASECMGGRSD